MSRTHNNETAWGGVDSQAVSRSPISATVRRSTSDGGHPERAQTLAISLPKIPPEMGSPELLPPWR